MPAVLIVGLGGFLGAAARYVLGAAIHRRLGEAFPYGTLAVNVLGCLAIGFVLHYADDRASVGPGARLFLVTGILGGFTTFSAFGAETLSLLRDRGFGPAALNISADLLLGLAAVWLGRTIPRGLAG
ncbi:MAG: fluoride efflux transporter CrcB [Planctomycetes bacterium]|nr:fluoride efflux transporter CrcB [Planctomycetota bacterium]